MFDKLKLNIARKIMATFVVNVHKNPEYLSKNGKYCERNALVAKTWESIDDLKKLV